MSNLGALTLEDIERSIRTEIKKSEIKDVIGLDIDTYVHDFVHSDSFSLSNSIADSIKDCIKFMALSMV